MVYSTEHRVFLVETYTKKSSYKICRHKFNQKYVPSKSMIERLVKNFHSTGSVLDKKKNRKRSVLTAEKLDEIGASLESSPRKSLTQLAVQYGMPLGSAHTAMRLLERSLLCSARKGTHQQVGWPNSAYSVSKVAVSALSFIQQRAFNADPREDLIVNAVHPGYVDTDMTSHTGPLTIEQGQTEMLNYSDVLVAAAVLNYLWDAPQRLFLTASATTPRTLPILEQALYVCKVF